GDPGIALDMVMRGVIFSDNINYQTLKNSPHRVNIRTRKQLFPGNSPASAVPGNRRRFFNNPIRKRLRNSEEMRFSSWVPACAGIREWRISSVVV
ncbi:MAG: hypothetical protein OXG62_02560, partial [Nitrospinae bacterium]|nr:hypothetical protein [Nitrospinota bacterium]